MSNTRRYPERPILGVGALILDRDRILLVERGRDPLKGFWSLPGGVLELGETLQQGIHREVLEETGLTVETLAVLEIFERIMRDPDGQPEYHYVLIDYVCRVTGGALIAGDDVSRAQWIERGDLQHYRITEGTVPVIEKAFKFQT
ncbi:MAG: NUDIX hydrolase [Bryobacteraceae bacterium]